MLYIITIVTMFINLAFAMDTQLDPMRVSIHASNNLVNLNGQNLAVHYIMYDGQIILKISDNLVAIFNSMVAKIKNDNNLFTYNINRSDQIIFEVSQLQSILEMPVNIGKFIDIKSEDITPIKKSLPRSYLLKLNINLSKREYIISKFAYKQIKNTIMAARNQKQMIRINLDFFPLPTNFSDKKAIDINFRAIVERNQRD